MNKKYWWIIIAIVIILLGSWYLNRETAEYSEITTERPYKGNPEASVVIVEYSDFQCPA
ncbi:thioredoxin domain-containing protein [bacterium]|nr:thioredoxin domain-containing protein [bacterium]